MLAVFVWIEGRVKEPMLNFRLFRHLNFLAANISQVLAGMVELGLGFLLPFYLLLVVGVDPAVAGLALIPGTVPIVLAGPLAGKAFDKVGGGFRSSWASSSSRSPGSPSPSAPVRKAPGPWCGLVLRGSASGSSSPSTTRPGSPRCPTRTAARRRG